MHVSVVLRLCASLLNVCPVNDAVYSLVLACRLMWVSSSCIKPNMWWAHVHVWNVACRQFMAARFPLGFGSWRGECWASVLQLPPAATGTWVISVLRGCGYKLLICELIAPLPRKRSQGAPGTERLWAIRIQMLHERRKTLASGNWTRQVWHKGNESLGSRSEIEI